MSKLAGSATNVDQVATLILKKVRRRGPQSRSQLAVELLLGTDNDLALIDAGIEQLIVGRQCERRPNHGRAGAPVRDQPVGVARPRWLSWIGL